MKAGCRGDRNRDIASCWGRLHSSHRGGWAGFTLLEILLVLTVVTVVIAVTWPVLLRYLDQQAIRTASRTVREHLADARAAAISNAEPWEFRAALSGAEYSIGPLYPDESDVAVSGGQATPGTQGPASSLPDGVQFAAETNTTLPATDELSVAFYADGTADDRTFLLTDRWGHTVNVRVRGLTGTAYVGPVEEGAVP